MIHTYVLKRARTVSDECYPDFDNIFYNSSDFQFYVNEGNSNLGSDTGSDLDSISLASEEDFAGKKTCEHNFTEKFEN